MGSLDANGIYVFDGTDAVSPLQTTLNLLAGSVSVKVQNMTDALTIEDTGWQTASLTSSFVVYGAGTEPRYRRVGKQVELAGAVKPATTTVANALPSGTNQYFTTLPADFRPSGYPRVYVCQGSSRARWTLTVNSNGTCGVARYGEGSADTGTWLPFAVTYLVG